MPIMLSQSELAQVSRANFVRAETELTVDSSWSKLYTINTLLVVERRCILVLGTVDEIEKITKWGKERRVLKL